MTSQLKQKHPFEPGDRVIWEPEVVHYGYKRYAHRVHFVEAAWIDHECKPKPMIKILGIEKPICATGFRLLKRLGSTSA